MDSYVEYLNAFMIKYAIFLSLLMCILAAGSFLHAVIRHLCSLDLLHLLPPHWLRVCFFLASTSELESVQKKGRKCLLPCNTFEDGAHPDCSNQLSHAFLHLIIRPCWQKKHKKYLLQRCVRQSYTSQATVANIKLLLWSSYRLDEQGHHHTAQRVRKQVFYL